MQREELEALGLDGETAGRVLELAGRDGEEQEKELRERHDEEMDQLRRGAAVENALLRAGAREPKTVLPLLDLRRASWEDGKLCGIAEQIEAVRGQAAYLFAGADAGGARVDSGISHGEAPSPEGGSMGAALRDYYR